MHIKFWIITVCVAVLSASTVYAHKVSVFGWVDGDQIYVEGRISGGKKPVGAKIEVFNKQGKLLHEGVTDRQGAYHFKIPETADLNIILKAGLGHQAEWMIPKEDLLVSRDESHSYSPVRSQPTELPDSSDATVKGEINGLTAADIERIVDRALDRKIKPVMAELADRQNSEPDIRDILGGLGYILGLIGLTAYLRYRKNEK